MTKAEMNFLIVGLGSMGKRRIRCLSTLGYQNVAGFDLREDRRSEANQKYAIKTYSDFDEAANTTKPDALFISVPPDVHHHYIKLAIERRVPFFVEASVVDTDMDLILRASRDVFMAPSATLLFHPAIQTISEIMASGELGKISNFMLHSGQYLEDWHTYEKVSDFYVSNPITGGAREIVPFELTWVTRLLGFPKRVCGNVRKTISIQGAESIDDTYNFLMDYEDFLATITVDVVSRNATRRVLVNGDKKQLVWNWSQNCVTLYNPQTSELEQISYKMQAAAPGYNASISEGMYIDEVQNFLAAAQGNGKFINDMENDWRVLKLLYAVEESHKTSQYVRFDT
jgi:predicted dehydrogenase